MSFGPIDKKDKNLEYASTMIRIGAIVLDVRNREEFCKAHLCGAWHINTKPPPLDTEAQHRLIRKLRQNVCTYPEATPIIVYSQKGIRSQRAKDILEMFGHRNVANLGGVDEEPLHSVMTGIMKMKGLDICFCKKN
jgi:rhodanese-related sulfurtransferase